MADTESIRELAVRALEEDGAAKDATVAYLPLSEQAVCARVIAGAAGVVAGIEVARIVFDVMDPSIGFDAKVADSDAVADGDDMIDIRGAAAGILSAERVALNFLQRLSGIATMTSRFVEQVAGTGIEILDTRKTTPLLRRLEKYAVTQGGGKNHRFNLSDMLLVKENHVRSVGGVDRLIDILSRERAPARVEVEVDSMAFLKKLLGCPVDRIMLDNFSPNALREAIDRIGEYRVKHPRFTPDIEVSGGIHLGNIREYAIAGVDYISIGALTHSAPALDMSLEVIVDEP